MPARTSVARKRRIEVAVGKYFANPLVTGLNRIGLMPSLMTENRDGWTPNRSDPSSARCDHLRR